MPLPRVQAFEFNDLDVLPAAARDTVVETLSRTLAWGRMLRGLVGPFEDFLAAAGVDEVLDLGSGGGGPATLLAGEITRAGRTPPRFLLTDLHPRREVWEEARRAHPGVIDFVSEPVDATAIPPHLAQGRARVLINVFHHLPPPLATAVLEDAVRGGHGVFIAEGFDRSPLAFANLAPAGIPALLANPVLSPRHRKRKALLTWGTPIGLGMCLWDGFVSTLRIYTEADLRRMVAPFGAGWAWEAGTFRYPPLGRGIWFRGVPRR